MKPILRTENVTKKFNGQELVLKGISTAMTEGSFTVILGQSGSGKTTLLNVMSGLLKPTTGEVWYEDSKITALSEARLADWKRAKVGSIFQNYLLLNHLTAEENIRIGLSPDTTALPFDRLTRILEIDDILKKFPSQLSGGQQQRVAIARAVIKNPSVLFCDEATGALDEANSKKVVELLHSLQSTFGITILFITHNAQIAETADRVITIKNGLISQDKINEHPISPSDMIWG